MAIMKLQTPIAALLLAALPAAALAAPNSGDRGGHASYSRPAASARSYRAAPQRSYTQRSYAAPQRSYNYTQRSYAAPQRSYTQRSYAAPQRSYNYTQPRYNTRTYTTRSYDTRSYNTRSYYGGNAYVSRGYAGHPRVSYVGNPWGWNGGRAWYASPRYWGGGFWGDFAIGLSFGDVGYYAVQPGYPGADLLANYGLTQTDCDQPNLVDIYGPDGSEICAYPNDMVGPGAYSVDPATLTLVSQ